MKAAKKGEYECNITLQDYFDNSKDNKEEIRVHTDNIKIILENWDLKFLNRVNHLVTFLLIG